MHQKNLETNFLINIKNYKLYEKIARVKKTYKKNGKCY